MIKPDGSRLDVSPEMAAGIMCFFNTGNRMESTCHPTFAE